MKHKKIYYTIDLIICFLIIILYTPILLSISILSRIFDFKNNSVFIGIVEIASNIHSIQDALISKEIKTNSLIITNKYNNESKIHDNYSTRNYIKNYNSSDYRSFLRKIYQRIFLVNSFIKYFFGNDQFYFVWSKTFLPLNLDLLFLKLSSKTVIMMQCGDEVRYRRMQSIIDDSFKIVAWKQSQFISNFLENFWFVWISEKTANYVISQRDQSTFQKIKYNFFNFPMESIENKKIKSNKIVIMHAPSNRKIKGTSIVLEAIEILKSKNLNFEFILVENSDNKKVLEQLSMSDILIDQPGVWAGRLAIEGCAAKCAVIGGNKGNYIGRYDSPIIQFEKDSIKLSNIIEKLIKNKNLLESTKKKCFEFWKTKYSFDAFVRNYSDMIQNKTKTFEPIPKQKNMLLNGCMNKIEYLIIKLFYNPS